MDASINRGAPLALLGPGRFTRVAIQTTAGEIEARLSEAGNWELRLRREEEDTWRIACRGVLPGRRDKSSLADSYWRTGKAPRTEKIIDYQKL
jgi:hypothetical protein